MEKRRTTPNKLSDAQREEIRRRYAAGERDYVLAIEFDVHPTTILWTVGKRYTAKRAVGEN